MLTAHLAQKYAQALYQLAAEKNMLDKVEEQLALVETTLTEHQELATLLYHPRVQAEAKKETITRIFVQDIDENVHKFLLLLVDKRRESILPAIISEYRNLSNQARNIAEAEVTTAEPLSDLQHTALAEKLSAVTGKNIVIKAIIDNRIMGGVIVKIGDKLIDGSVVRQLHRLKTALLTSD